MPPFQGWNPPELPPKRGKSVHVVKAGNLVYVAGQTAEDVDGSVVGIGDPDAQARKAYSGVAKAIRAAGGTPDDIVHLTMYVTDRDHLPAIRGGKPARRLWRHHDHHHTRGRFRSRPPGVPYRDRGRRLRGELVAASK